MTTCSDLVRGPACAMMHETPDGLRAGDDLLETRRAAENKRPATYCGVTNRPSHRIPPSRGVLRHVCDTSCANVCDRRTRHGCTAFARAARFRSLRAVQHNRRVTGGPHARAVDYRAGRSALAEGFFVRFPSTPASEVGCQLAIASQE